MVVLPARGADFGVSASWFAIAPTLLLVCRRTLGQILGPFVAIYLNMDRICRWSWSMSVSLLIYVFAYILALHVPSLVAAVSLCVFAHIASNVVFAIGNYQVMKAFKPHEIGWAAGFLYRTSTLAIGIVGLGAGAIAERFGINSVIVASVLCWIVGSFLWRSQDARA